MRSNADLVARIRKLGLPVVVARIATEGGESVSPALFSRADAVFHDPVGEIERGTAEDLVSLWSFGTARTFAGQGRYLIRGPENDEPSAVFPRFAELVRELLTDGS